MTPVSPDGQSSGLLVDHRAVCGAQEALKRTVVSPSAINSGSMERIALEAMQSQSRAADAQRLGTGIAALGPEGSFTSVAATKLARVCGVGAQFVSSVEESLALVTSGSSRWALVAVETNLRGDVEEHRRAITEAGLPAQLEAVDHATFVLAVADPGARLETVCSHPHALEECAGWIGRVIPGATWLPTSSTAEAAQLAWAMTSVGAICSADAARTHGLSILEHDIADPPGDITRFLLVGERGLPQAAGRAIEWKSTIVLSPISDQLVPLNMLMDIIVRSDVVVARIQALPAARALGECVLLLDVVHGADARPAELLRHEAEGMASVELLETFPIIDLRAAPWTR